MISRPFQKSEVFCLMIAFSWLVVYPILEIYRTEKSENLATYVSEGVVGFKKIGKYGYLTLVDGKPYMCAFMASQDYDCGYKLAPGAKLPSDTMQWMTGKHAVVRWAENRSLGLKKDFRSLVELSIDGRLYRTAADYDQSLDFRKRIALEMAFFIFFLLFLYIGVRIVARFKLIQYK